MKYIILFIKGLIIGLGKILPGISGSVLAIVLGVYEKAMFSIMHIFNKSNIKYLFFLGSGILISIILFSNLINYLLNGYYFIVMFFLTGLLFGTIPNLVSHVKVNKKSDLFITLIPIIIICFIKKISLLNIKISYITLGVIESITTLIPGISGTAIYMMLNRYNMVLNLFCNPWSFDFALFSIGIIITSIILCFLLNYLFKKCHNQLYLFVTSLSIYSFIYLLKGIIQKINLLYFLLFIIGFLISYFLNKIQIKE